MQTSGTAGLRTRAVASSGKFANLVARQIGMLRHGRAIDEPDFHIGATDSTIHQRSDLD
jgi:hypothetical protein